jgi:chemotaxis protein CheC
MKTITLTEDEKDALQELINIAYGRATAVIADMLDAFASLSIPKIEIMTTIELINIFAKLKKSSYFFSAQAFMGEFSGESAFFIDEESANNLATHLELENKEDLDDAILELTNILTSSLTTEFVQEIGTDVTYTVPSIVKLSSDELENNETIHKYSQVIVIETELNFKEHKINGQIFIFTKDGSIKWLKKRLNSILEALT